MTTEERDATPTEELLAMIVKQLEVITVKLHRIHLAQIDPYGARQQVDQEIAEAERRRKEVETASRPSGPTLVQ